MQSLNSFFTASTGHWLLWTTLVIFLKTFWTLCCVNGKNHLDSWINNEWLGLKSCWFNPRYHYNKTPNLKTVITSKKANWPTTLMFFCPMMCSKFLDITAEYCCKNLRVNQLFAIDSCRLSRISYTLVDCRPKN